MNVKTVSRLINSPPHTIRRWTNLYGPFLSGAAAPPAGVERDFVAHDLKVLQYIAGARKAHRMHEDIMHELEALQRASWEGLPDIPKEWVDRAETGMTTVAESSERAQLVADNATLQIRLQTVMTQLEEAQTKAETLQRRLDDALISQRTTEGEVADIRVELANTRGDVRALQAQLAQYGFGRDRPLPVGVIILVTASAVALLIIILVIVLQLAP